MIRRGRSGTGIRGRFGFGRPGAGRGRVTAFVSLVAASATLLATLTLFPSGPTFGQEAVFREHYFSDTRGDQAYYFDITGAAGVIRGEGGVGGPVRPDDPVTRAEFAVMVVRLLALDPRFKAPGPPGASTPSFRDAASIPTWAASAVSTASALGIITGIPDGRGGFDFNPTGPVNGAEALAMLLRALGNADAVAGGWPAGYVFRAYETGLCSSDVTANDWRYVSPLAPLNRAQIAYLLHNALFSPRGYTAGPPGREATYSRSAIGQHVSGYALVTDANLTTRSLTTSNGRSLQLAGTVVAPDARERSDLLGRRIYWIRNERGQIAYLRRFGREASVTGRLGHLDPRADGSGVESVVLADGRALPCSAGAIVELNGQRWPFDPATILPVAEVTAILDRGQAVYVSILQEDLPEAVIRTISFDAPAGGAGARTSGGGEPGGGADRPSTGKITATISMGQGEIPLTVTADTDIYLNGEPADLSDLRERDVFYAATEGSVPKFALRLYVYRSRVTGTVRNVSRYYTGPTSVVLQAQVEEPGGQTRTLSFSSFVGDVVSVDLIGQDFTFFLNRLGQVTHFEPPGPAADRPAVVKVLRVVTARGRRLLTVDWRGEELTYLLPGETTAPPAATLVRLTPTADGDAARSLQSVGLALFQATVVGYDPAQDRLLVARESLTWGLAMRRVPIYAVADLDRQQPVGRYVEAASLAAGQAIWLDDPGAPSYALVSGR